MRVVEGGCCLLFGCTVVPPLSFATQKSLQNARFWEGVPRNFPSRVLHDGILPPKLWGSIKEVVPDTPTKGRGASTHSLLARGRPVYDPRSSMH